MTTIKWYAHGPYSCEGQILEELDRTVDDEVMTKLSLAKLAQGLRNYFYEVEFDVEVDESTGEILDVKIAPKKQHESKKIRK